MSEDENVQIHVRVSKEVRQRLKLLADDDGSSLMAVAEALLEQALEKEDAVRHQMASPLGERVRTTKWHSVAPYPVRAENPVTTVAQPEVALNLAELAAQRRAKYMDAKDLPPSRRRRRTSPP